MANITKVPNGPLIKPKGPFKGSTLKTGGVIKKAQTGINLTPQQKRAQLDSITAVKRSDIIRKKDSILDRNASAQGLTREQVRAKQEADKKKPDANNSNLSGQKSGPDGCKAIGKAARARGKNGLTLKAGGMIKRADGSMSKRGLWNNIRKNKGSGKNPTKQMLVQEKKIKSKK
jgi:hypothetical protein